MLTVVNLILGAGLLTAGRKLFWLFVAAIGFIAGTQFLGSTANLPAWMSLAAGVILGLLFAGLALFFKNLAIGVAGFLGGGMALVSLANMAGVEAGPMTWVAFLVGGILGVVLLSQLFDWALILTSSIGGAVLVTQSLGMDGAIGTIGLVTLIVIGVILQAKVLSEERRHA